MAEAKKLLTLDAAISAIEAAVQKYKDKGDYKDAVLSFTIDSTDVLSVVNVKTTVHNLSGRMYLKIDSFVADTMIPIAAVNHKTIRAALIHPMIMRRMLLIHDKLTLADAVSSLIAEDQQEMARAVMDAVCDAAKEAT